MSYWFLYDANIGCKWLSSKIRKQIDRAVMQSPSASALANIVLVHHELSELKGINYWHCVNDIVCTYKYFSRT